MGELGSETGEGSFEASLFHFCAGEGRGGEGREEGRGREGAPTNNF